MVAAHQPKELTKLSQPNPGPRPEWSPCTCVLFTAYLLGEEGLPHGGGEEDCAWVAPAGDLDRLLLVVLHLVRRQLDLVPLYRLHRQVHRVCKE